MLVHTKLKGAHGAVVYASAKPVGSKARRLTAPERKACRSKTEIGYVRVGIGTENTEITAADPAHRLKALILTCHCGIVIGEPAAVERAVRRSSLLCKMLSPTDAHAAGLFRKK